MKSRLLILKRITDDVSRQSIMSDDTICAKMSRAKVNGSGVSLKKFKTSSYGLWGQ